MYVVIKCYKKVIFFIAKYIDKQIIYVYNNIKCYCKEV